MRVRRREPGDVRQRVLRTARFAGEGGGDWGHNRRKGEKGGIKIRIPFAHTRARPRRFALTRTRLPRQRWV